MRFLIDTNILSEALHKPNGTIARKIRRKKPGSVAISIITAGEAHFGFALNNRDRLAAAFEKATKAIPILPLHPGAAPIYGTLRAHLQKAGTPIGPNDLLIAAHALHQKLILVTNNEKEFKRVPGLKVENWSSQP